MSVSVLRAALAAMLLTAAPALAQQQQQPQSLPTEQVVVQTPSGPIAFVAEIADDAGERAIGLMYRDDLAEDRAMLFDYAPPQPVFMWMKNTRIPLDMLFIAADGIILHVEQGARPGDLTPRGTADAVRGVLEVPGGTVDRLGITPGMIVKHRIFGNGSTDVGTGSQ